MMSVHERENQLTLEVLLSSAKGLDCEDPIPRHPRIEE